MWLLCITIIFSIVNLIVVCGNILVLYIIITQKSLHTATNAIVLSLTVADFLLGCIIIPFALLQNYFGVWYFGNVWCQIWLALDIWLSTASIYNLLAITFDRYMAVRDPIKYKLISSSKMTKITISLVWVISAMLAVFKLIIDFWLNSQNSQKIDSNLNMMTNDTIVKISFDSGVKECTPLTNYPAYIIFSASISFILPLFAMIEMNACIVQTVSDSCRKQSAVRKINSRGNSVGKSCDQNGEYTQLRIHRGVTKPIQSCNASHERIAWKGKTRRNSFDNKFYQYTTTNNEGEKINTQKWIDYGNGHGTQQNMRLKKISHSDRLKKKISTRSLGPSANFIITTEDKEMENTNLECSQSIHELEKDEEDFRVSSSENDYKKESKASTTTSSDNIALWHAATVPIILYKGPSQLKTQLSMAKKTLFSSRISSNSSNKNLSKQQSTEYRVARTIVIVVGCFAICWIPFTIVYLSEAFESCSNNKCIPQWLFTLTFWLGYANSAINPLIYSAFSRDFSTAFKKVLFRKKKKLSRS
uniref:GH10322p (inferred by orthology to a D. melanogaster protein) n=1 Tax=Strongyloides venezuelensis TaxID=75913 RepID=A0A0K0F0C9_STRVS